jgi:hypothetical protein
LRVTRTIPPLRPDTGKWYSDELSITGQYRYRRTLPMARVPRGADVAMESQRGWVAPVQIAAEANYG